VVLVAPLAEEIVFRGYVNDVLTDAFGERRALLVTSLLFGFVHGIERMVPIALLGLLFGWLRNRYDSLRAGFLAHATHNAITVGLTLLWPQSLDLYPR
jgi:CAAX protease family protein